MLRIFVIAAAGLAVLGGVSIAAAPMVARYVAEAKVDAALARIRFQTTSVVNRGDVSVDLRSLTVTVKDLAIDGAGDSSHVKIGALTIERPWTDDGLLKADRVTFEDLTIRSAGETITAPRVDIFDYSGPERGLTATPGVGRNARSQADLIAQVSLQRASAPTIVFLGDQTGVRRTVRNIQMRNVVNGLVGKAGIAEIAIEAPPPDATATGGPGTILARSAAYEEVNLPTLWRFYAGDGGSRDRMVKSATIARVDVSIALQGGRVVKAESSNVRVEDVELRPLAFPVTTFDPIAMKIRLGHPLTPAEIRQQLQFATDVAKSVSFDRASIGRSRLEVSAPGSESWSAEVGGTRILGYEDARIESTAAKNFAFMDSSGRSVKLAVAEISKFDASGLLAYAERVGRDEVLMTLAPTPEDIVRIAPRIARLDAQGFDAAGPAGELSVAGLRIDVNAPLDAVPQRLAFRLDRLDAKPAPGALMRRALDAAELPSLSGSASFTLLLEPAENSLSLEAFDYAFEGLGSITGKGELLSVDPTLAISTGTALFDKISAVELGSFKFTAKDDGAVALILERAAKAAREPIEMFRERIAQETQETIGRLFGPPAVKSAEAAADFIRNPRTVEVTLNPRDADQTLLDLIRAVDLGPAGVAQVIELSVLYRR